MRRARRQAPTAHGLDELGALRDKLVRSSGAKAAPASRSASASPEPPRPGPAPAPSGDDAAILRAALRDVQPIAKAQGRVELAPPKPAPVPRPRAPEPEEAEPGPARRRPDTLEGTALFRSAMADVTPLKDVDRAEVGRPLPRHAQPALHEDRYRPGSAEPPPLLLPPDADVADPETLFRHAVRGAQPLDQGNRVELERPAPAPEPKKRSEDEREALRESLEAPLTFEDRLDMGDEAAFLRTGLPRRVLTDLRRGRWVLQAELDLHGLNRDEARAALSTFLAASLQRGHRCVRVIHGKGLGSPGKVSILKQLSRGWLAQREEILAFCQAGPHAGGSGALLVLLKGRTAVRDGGAASEGD